MTLSGDQRPCAFPPHPGGDGDGPRFGAESSLSRFRGWLAHAPAERVPLPAIPAVWAAAEIMHLVAVPGLYPGAAAVAATGLAFGLGEARARDGERKRLRGAELAAATAVTGAWVTAADVMGPLAGRYHLLSIAYALGAAAGYWWLRRHEAVKAARAARDEHARWIERKAGWHRRAHALGLNGSHLLHWQETRLDENTLLGERMLVDTRGTGKRASALASGTGLAELIAEHEMLPRGRVDVTPDRMAGRMWITIRRADPWAKPIPHPLTVKDSPWAKYVPYPATIREPVTIGIDPETGKPLQVRLWDKKGGKVVLVAGKKDAGKTVLLNNLRAGITACPDAILLQVNLAKALQEEHWSPLAPVTAALTKGKARRTLLFACDAGQARTRSGRHTPVHQPTPHEPLIVLIVDEVDAVAVIDQDPETGERLLAAIASKCRSEGVALVVAGQRATAEWLGGGNVRANLDIAVWGKFSRSGEAGHIAGSEYQLPDMGEYGEGESGVFGVTELPPTGEISRGRTFVLDDLDDIDRIVTARLADRRPYVPEPALAGLAEAWASITGTHLGDGEDVPDATPGTSTSGGTAAKIAAARGRLTETVDVPPIPPGREAEAADMLAERRREFMAGYTDFELPEADQAKLRAMLTRAGGISTRDAAGELPWSHTYVHRQLTRWCAEGTAQMTGTGAGRRYHAAPGPPPGTAATPGPAPYLWAVPDPGEPGPAAAEGSIP
jgi:hypothetical protein